MAAWRCADLAARSPPFEYLHGISLFFFHRGNASINRLRRLVGCRTFEKERHHSSKRAFEKSDASVFFVAARNERKKLYGSYLEDAAERPLDKCRHRIKAEFQPRYGASGAMAAAAEVVELAEAWGITPAELSLAWAIARPCNASVIIGTTTVRQVEECVNAALLDLPEELMSAVDKIHEKYRNPCMFYADKEAWKSVEGRAACEPEA